MNLIWKLVCLVIVDFLSGLESFSNWKKNSDRSCSLIRVLSYLYVCNVLVFDGNLFIIWWNFDVLCLEASLYKLENCAYCIHLLCQFGAWFFEEFLEFDFTGDCGDWYCLIRALLNLKWAYWVILWQIRLKLQFFDSASWEVYELRGAS